MRASGIHDITYIQQPGWFVAHRLPFSGAHSPKRLSVITSLVAGLTLVAVSAAMISRLASQRGPIQETLNRQNQLQTPLAPTAETIAPQNSATQAPPPIHEGTAKNEQHTTVTINGQSISVPENGNIHRTYSDGQTESTVDIHINTQSNSTAEQ
jgi:hypothetical protein